MKLTLTIEGDVIRAKEYARFHNQSLSGMVGSYLLALTVPVDREPHKHAPQVARLKGVIRLPENFDKKKAMSDALKKRHRR
ncbi:DUF6364 family protein [Chitinophaga sp. 22620]|uniref:DUF6364 family protein n=1 Tax=Chitinophaga sp. 22620 TaxID=3453952 RepID=UPI003F85BD29